MELKNGFIKNKLADKYIVVPTGEAADGASDNLMIKLNETAGEIWDLIDAGYDTEEIVQRHAEQHGIDIDHARNSVNRIIDEMKKIGAFK